MIFRLSCGDGLRNRAAGRRRDTGQIRVGCVSRELGCGVLILGKFGWRGSPTPVPCTKIFGLVSVRQMGHPVHVLAVGCTHAVQRLPGDILRGGVPDLTRVTLDRGRGVGACGTGAKAMAAAAATTPISCPIPSFLSLIPVFSRCREILISRVIPPFTPWVKFRRKRPRTRQTVRQRRPVGRSRIGMGIGIKPPSRRHG